jgi:hypothetical protein
MAEAVYECRKRNNRLVDGVFCCKNTKKNAACRFYQEVGEMGVRDWDF